MSTTKELPLGSIDALSARLPAPGTADVTIEIVGEEIGDQIQVQRLPWHALIYDPTARVLELSVGARGRSIPVVFRHEIHDPQRLWLEEDGGVIRAISVEQGDGVQTIVRLYARRALESVN
ncbi:MAG TPA: DUF5335 family protein [Acidimicrobiia bacterium]|nr:DUF5335 family protein [Acidimicrobiia bacterium]